MKINHEHEQAVVQILAKDAFTANDIKTYFQTLILKANLPEPVKMERISALKGDAEFDALRLVNWATSYGTNPEDKNAALASVVLPRMTRLGIEDATTLAAIIVSYRLVPPDKLNTLRSQFQIPQSLAKIDSAPPATIGPEFKWVGPADEITLQSWLSPEPEFLEVALLQNAVNRARSICRVEVPALGERGTGVLIADDLVLTNYHVMTKRADDLVANAHGAVLRFGAFTAEKPEASPSTGQEIKLAKEPVVEASPVSEYDFVLLRTDGSKAKDTVPAPFVSQLPATKSAMHILQHPQGGPMMLALSKNGVTTVDAGAGKIQYVTRAAGGSSGSPCFDEQWNLVALHHAEVSQTFGSIREGILMKSIFGRIQKYLNGASLP